MRRKLLAKQSGTALSSRFGVLLEHVSNAPPAHRLTPKIDEHLWGSERAAHRQPGAQRCGRALPQWERPFSPSLAINANAHRRQRDIVEPQPDQFRYT